MPLFNVYALELSGSLLDIFAYNHINVSSKGTLSYTPISSKSHLLHLHFGVGLAQFELFVFKQLYICAAAPLLAL